MVWFTSMVLKITQLIKQRMVFSMPMHRHYRGGIRLSKLPIPAAWVWEMSTWYSRRGGWRCFLSAAGAWGARRTSQPQRTYMARFIMNRYSYSIELPIYHTSSLKVIRPLFIFLFTRQTKRRNTAYHNQQWLLHCISSVAMETKATELVLTAQTTSM